MRAYTVSKIRRLEEVAIAAAGNDVLMQRAAAGVAACASDLLGRARGAVYGARVAVLVGPGNNGGDALFAGARLARRGARVTAVRCLGTPHAAGLAALLSAGGRSARPRPARCNRGIRPRAGRDPGHRRPAGPAGRRRRAAGRPGPVAGSRRRGRSALRRIGRYRCGAGRRGPGGAYGHLRRTQALPSGRAGAQPLRRGEPGRHRTGRRRRDRRPARPRGRPTWRPPGPSPTSTATSTAAGSSASTPAPTAIPAPRSWACTAPCTPAPAWSASWVGSARRRSSRPNCPTWSSLRGGSRRTCSAPAGAIGTTVLRCWRPRPRAASRRWSTRTACATSPIRPRTTGCSPRTPASWPRCSAGRAAG